MTHLLTSPAASSVLACVTTIHLVLAAIRSQRRAPVSFSLLLTAGSVAFAGVPWLWPSVLGIAAGVGAHGLWFVMCERVQRGRGGRRSTTGAEAAWVKTRILDVVRETPEVSTFRMVRPEGFAFIPGQFITIRRRIGERDHTRCYSISSSPMQRDWISISVRSQGLVSGALHEALRAGSIVHIMGPQGAFVYPADSQRPIVLVAGGIGITPLVSMVRHALATEPARRVTLLYSARTDREFAFRGELQALAARHPQFHLHLASSATTDPSIYPGRIDIRLITAVIPDVAQSVFCMCGPGAMLAATGTLLRELGVPATQIRYERFEAAVAASRVANPDETFTMTCAESGCEVPVAGGQTLLDAAERANVEMRSMCRAGVCGSCRVRVTKGEAHCASETLSEEDRRAGYVLACVSTPCGNLTVQA